MSRLPKLDEGAMDAAQRNIAAEIISSGRGSIAGPFEVWLRSPVFADRAQKLGQFLRYNTSLPPRLSELAILFTARHWTSQFEWHAHEGPARTAGIPDAVIRALAEGRRPDFAEADAALVYDFCAELYATRTISAATFDRARALFSETTLVELVGLLGYYALVSMTLNVFDVEVPGGKSPLTPHASGQNRP